MKIIPKLYAAGVIFLIGLMTAGCGNDTELSFSAAGESLAADGMSDEEAESGIPPEEEPQEICVYICGAVVSPGVYVLPAGSRAVALIEAAGGLSGEADERYINQAALLADGQQITVPTKAETAGYSGPAAENGGPSDDRVDINTADSATLMTLPGIGEAKAAAIIEYREKYGSFERPEDIKNVSGIKGAVYEKIRDRIRTGP